MTQYVLGFLIDPAAGHVVVIKKNRPPWQAGRFNGVGGKVEANELLFDAMRREFREETGHDREDWERYLVLCGHGFQLHVFRAFDADLPFKVETKTDEAVAVVRVDELDTTRFIPNVTWLVPMALSMDKESAREFIVSEHY